jgi:hypothetical protein
MGARGRSSVLGRRWSDRHLRPAPRGRGRGRRAPVHVRQRPPRYECLDDENKAVSCSVPKCVTVRLPPLSSCAAPPSGEQFSLSHRLRARRRVAYGCFSAHAAPCMCAVCGVGVPRVSACVRLRIRPSRTSAQVAVRLVHSPCARAGRCSYHQRCHTNAAYCGWRSFHGRFATELATARSLNTSALLLRLCCVSSLVAPCGSPFARLAGDGATPSTAVKVNKIEGVRHTRAVRRGGSVLHHFTWQFRRSLRLSPRPAHSPHPPSAPPPTAAALQ